MNKENNPNKNNDGKIKWIIILVATCLSIITVMNSLSNVVNQLVEQKATEILTNYQATQDNIETLDEKTEELKGNTIAGVEIDLDKVKDDDVSEIIEKYKNSLVSVRNYQRVQTLSTTGELTNTNEITVNSSGTGVIVGDNKEELWIATNYHVIAGARFTEIVFADNETVMAETKGFIAEKDLAVLSVKLSALKESTIKNITCAKIGDSTTIKQGQSVMAIGDALHQGISTTKGIISLASTPVPLTTNGDVNVIQIDAPINSGDSGGALLNTKGELIGILVAKYVGDDVESIGYALPISDIKNDISVLCARNSRMQVDIGQEVYLGVTVMETTEGLLIESIESHSPAYNSQLHVGDKITKINDQNVTTFQDLQNELWFYKSGQIVTLRILRPEGKEYVNYNVNIVLSLNPNN